MGDGFTPKKELLPHQAVALDELLERRHTSISWNRRQGATHLGIHALVLAAIDSEPNQCFAYFADELGHRHIAWDYLVALSDLALRSVSRVGKLVSFENRSFVVILDTKLGVDFLRGRHLGGCVMDLVSPRMHNEIMHFPFMWSLWIRETPARYRRPTRD